MADQGTFMGEVHRGWQRFWASSWKVKGPVLGVVAFLALAGMGGALSGGDDHATVQAERDHETATATEAGATATAEATEDEATVTPTGSATSTPSPSPTSTATPTPEPEPVVLSGSGQFASDAIELAPGVHVATVSYTGGSNFIIWAYPDSGTDELLVNTIGSYSGTRPLYGGSYIFDIDSAGAWTISIEPIGAEVGAAESIEGQGDRVSGIFAGPGRGAWEVSHMGESNFIAWVHCSDSGSNLVANEIGIVSGSTVVDAEGICFWEIEADGSWSLTAR